MYLKLALVVAASLLPRVDVPPRPADAYRPPVDRPVLAPFDVSRGPYGAGNRGLDYAVRPGDVVVAIGAGTVVFAGPVAGRQWVTILHPDGLRSSSGPLASVVVAAGRPVAAGTPIGSTGHEFHLGVRRGDTYVDPATLFGTRARHARLVPVGPRRAGGQSGRSVRPVG